MNRNRLVILLALAAAAGLSGCGGAAGDAGDSGARAAASPGANVASPAPAAAGATQTGPAGGAAVAPSPSTTGGATQPNANIRGDGRGNLQQANAPAPQIGSGGNDFSLFTQARGALNSDAELKAANITVEVKEGVVTLSGALANDGQKSKAERLVRAVGGVKDVKNQLRVSGGA